MTEKQATSATVPVMDQMAALDNQTDDASAKKMISLGELFGRVRQRLAQRNLAFDPRGHSTANVDNDLILVMCGASEADLSAVDAAFEAGTIPFSASLTLGKSSTLHRCAVCGEHLQMATDGRSLFPTTACSYSDGVPLTFELNVPSGVMVVGNDFRGHFDILGEYDTNTAVGCMKTTHAMAAIGCAHAFVGNSCPGVYRVGRNQFIIAASGYDEETDAKIEPKGRRVAGICTDLWWYSIVDGDEFARRGCDGHYSVDRIEVKPGVYTFTHLVPLKGFDFFECSRPTVYTRIEWSRPPDPVIDYISAWRAMNFTAGQVIANSIQRYPTLYSGPDAVRRVADHIFCVIGGGGSWHPNGFVQYDPDMKPDDPEVEIPVFDGLYRWYPLSQRYSDLCRAAGLGEGEPLHLNPSFAALALNVARCIVQYGSKGSPENVEIAKQCLAGLEARYPDLAR